MRRSLSIAALAGFLSSCVTTTTPIQTLHREFELRPGVAYICMAPDGTLAREKINGSSVFCPPPARFVSQPYCEVDPVAPRDTAGYHRARARAARDGTLEGDMFEGQPFCAVPLRGPPLPR